MVPFSRFSRWLEAFLWERLLRDQDLRSSTCRRRRRLVSRLLFLADFFPFPGSSGVLYQVFHDEGINNGFPLGARVLPDVRGMGSKSRTVKSSIIARFDPPAHDDLPGDDRCFVNLSVCQNVMHYKLPSTRLDLIFFIYNSVSILELLRL